ncbi:MAG: WcaF family extracellular polysaccharide biosynthesis acetyltransferase [Verrucomicrobiota bacterium]
MAWKTNTDTRTGASFSLQNRFARLGWGIVQATLFRWSPNPLHEWRSWLLRLFGAKIGKGVHVYPKVLIWAPWNLELGDHVGVGNGAILYSQDELVIGERAVISQGVHLCTGTHDYDDPGFALYTKPIEVGAEAWLAAEVFVHPGVVLGEGVVVGARSVVVKDLPGWTVCAGFPAKVIKERNRLRK